MKLNISRLKILMLDNGLNISSLALKSGVSRQWLGTCINRGRAGVEVIGKIAKVFEVKPSFLIESEG